MTKQTEDEILKEAQAYSAALDRREERKEVYLAMLRFLGAMEPSDLRYLEDKAESIYQGMIEFCGVAK